MTSYRHAVIGITLVLVTSFSQAQAPAERAEPVVPENPASDRADADADAESADSTVVYDATYFEPYNPVSANDMLDRIPGLNLGGPGGGGGGRGLGTGGNLLIDGQRIAGKDNSPRDQLDRIAAREVERIEIIRDTSGALAVRGAGQVVNIVLQESASRTSTSAELVSRLNHDDTLEAGANVSHSRQVGNFQALINLEARPNYENSESRETQFNPANEVVGTLFESNIRDQDEYQASANMSYHTGPHRMQFNTQLGEQSYPRSIDRDFIEFENDEAVPFTEQEQIDNDESNWEVGGEYEYTFTNDTRFQLLFVANEEVRDSVRERFASDRGDPGASLDKNLFIESNRTTTEKIVQGNYSFSLNDEQSLRLGLERANTELESSLFIASNGGSEPPSDRFGGLSPLPELNNPGTQVQEIRYEGFAFHNWALNERMNLESSLLYEASEISQSGTVEKTRDFNFLRPSVDYRFNITDNFQFRASVRRDVSQLSFANFAATADEGDRETNADAGNPELVPEKAWNYSAEVEYRLPEDAGVLSTRVFYADIEDYIGTINATVDPDNPLSATGNIGPAERWGMFINASSRLTYWNQPDAVASLDVGLFDSSAVDPFLGTEQRIGGRGFARFDFRHDITEFDLTYGIDYNYPFNGGNQRVDINTITEFYNDTSLGLFVSKVMFDDITFRLESNNTLDDARCRDRSRFDGTTIDGTLRLLEESCSSRGRRLTLRVQTTF